MTKAFTAYALQQVLKLNRQGVRVGGVTLDGVQGLVITALSGASRLPDPGSLDLTVERLERTLRRQREWVRENSCR
jgi:hypothetical protein